MAEATLTTVSAALKEVYGPRIEKQYVQELTALKRIERTSEGVVETVGGKYVDFPIKVGRSSGVSNRKENEQLGSPDAQKYSEVHVPLYYSYARARITGQAMELADTNYQAFASMLEEEMDGVKDDRLQDDARQVYGDGTGLLASVTADGANTVTVDTTQYLEEGMRIDILTRSDGTVVASNRKITDITGLVVTYDGSDVAATATEGLYRQGNFTDAEQREVTGFQRIVSETAILHGINPSTVKKWKGNVEDNSGTPRALSEGLMIRTVDSVRIAGGGQPTVAFSGLGVRRSYFNLLTQQRQFVNSKQFDGGLVGLAFHYGGKEIPIVDDPLSPPEQMLFISEPKVKVYRSKPYYWADKDGSVFKWVTDYDSWEALLKQYWEIGTTQRNAHALLSDLIEG